MDALRHVNNVAFLQLLEEARVRFLSEIDAIGVGEEFGVLVARNEIDYLRPLLYSVEPVSIHTWIEHVGTSSFTVAYVVHDPAGEAVAAAKTVVVAIRPDGRSAPLPAAAREALLTWR